MSGQTKGYSGTDKFDGDLAYPVPEDYRTRRPDVRYGEAREVEYDSKTVGKRRKAIVVLPPEYSEDRKYPVVYLCHGLGQDQTQWLEEGDVPVIAGNMMADGWTQEMVLVLPNCRARERDEADPEDAFSLANYNAFNKFLEEFVDDLQPFIEENFAVAAGRENTAIAGFSMGGRVALYLGMALQGTFGYIGAFCPAPGIFPYTQMGVTEEGLFTEESFDLKSEYRDRTFIMIVAGKSDTLVGAYPESYHNALQKNGVGHIWYKKTGGHDMNVSGQGLYHFLESIFWTEILNITVRIEETHHIDGSGCSVTMITFSGFAEGPYFTGNIVPGAVDTQLKRNSMTISARYMLEGTDKDGQPCSIFIENNAGAGDKYTVPYIITDSRALGFIEHASLRGKILSQGDQLNIKIFSDQTDRKEKR